MTVQELLDESKKLRVSVSIYLNGTGIVKVPFANLPFNNEEQLEAILKSLKLVPDS